MYYSTHIESTPTKASRPRYFHVNIFLVENVAASNFRKRAGGEDNPLWEEENLVATRSKYLRQQGQKREEDCDIKFR